MPAHEESVLANASPMLTRPEFSPTALARRCTVGSVVFFTASSALALAAALLLSSCATKGFPPLVGSDLQPLSVHYSAPQRKNVDADFLVAVEQLVGRTDLARPEPSAQPGAPAPTPAPTQVNIRLLSATLDFVSFVYDQDSQTREYIGRVSCRVQMWLGTELIEDWTFTRERPFSVRPREHQRSARLREYRAELAGWAAQEWFEDLHWRASSSASLTQTHHRPK